MNECSVVDCPRPAWRGGFCQVCYETLVVEEAAVVVER